MSLDGTLYCYRNPLAWSGNDPNDKIRNPWYDTTCCPPNIERTLSSLPGHFYATSPDGLWVHLYHNAGLLLLEWQCHLQGASRDGVVIKMHPEAVRAGGVEVARK